MYLDPAPVLVFRWLKFAVIVIRYEYLFVWEWSFELHMAGLQLRTLDKNVLNNWSNLKTHLLSLLFLFQKLLYVNLARFHVCIVMTGSISYRQFASLFIQVLTVLLLRIGSLTTCKPLILHQYPVHVRFILCLSLEARPFWRHLYQIDLLLIIIDAKNNSLSLISLLIKNFNIQLSL